MEKTIVCLNPLAIRILAAQVKSLREETNKIPTILIEAAITKATITIKIK